MTTKLRLYDGSSLATAITIALGPGDTSSTYSRSVWNAKGEVAGYDTATGLRLVLEALSGSTWVRQGLPILDQGWCSLRVTSVTNTGDATFGPYSTGTKRIGSGSEFELPDLPMNCAYNVDLIVFGAASLQTTAIELRLVAVDDQNSYGLANKLGLVGAGIIPGWRDAALRKIAYGVEPSAAGTDVVTISAGLTDYDGLRVASIESTHTLNQNDAAAAALAAGESYVATLSIADDGTRTATKGAKGTVPTAPAVPADEIFVGWVTVVYDVGGTSIIDTADLSGAVIRGDYFARAGSGLTVEIHSGSAISETSHYQFHGTTNIVTLPASDTSYIWLNPDGTFEDNTTGVKPQDGSTLLYEADTDGSGVTALRDRRVYLTLPWTVVPITLRCGNISGTSSAPIAWDVAPEDCDIDRTALDAGANTGGGSGSWIADVLIADAGEPTAGTWTSAFPSSGTEDLRPQLVYNATVLTAESVLHETRRVKKGQRIGVIFPAVAASGTLTDARVTVFVRRYR